MAAPRPSDSNPRLLRPQLRLTPDLIARIAANVRLGMPLRRAAWAEGVPEHFAAAWLRAGEREDQTGASRAFYEAVHTARAEGQRQLVRNLRVAADAGNTRAAMFLLRSRWADDFQVVTHLDVDVMAARAEIRRAAEVDLADQSEDELRASLRVALAAAPVAAAAASEPN